MTDPVRTRFAPSPTGSLHIGGVRTALYCLLWARRTGGQFLLRIEDTDRVRSTDEAARGIVRDLQWVGLQWDEGPGLEMSYGSAYQSERLPSYAAAARTLLDQGLAYEAWESPEELDAERRAAEARKENFRYHRRTYTDAQLATYRAEGRKPVVRIAAPVREITIHDVILGDVTVEAGGIDDFVIVKADGFPTYHFAVVIDDHAMNVGLVLRGQEHLMNTHKHQLLYDAFGWIAPAHGHLPLIFNPTGSKMSKRDKAKAAREGARAVAKAEGQAASDWAWLSARTGLTPDVIAAFQSRANDGVATAEAIARALGVELPKIEVQDFRVAGYLPEALVNYLGLLGWSPGDDRELLTIDEMCAVFDVSRVIKTPARFDAEKLAWMNGEYMKSLPEDVLERRMSDWLEVAQSPIAALDVAGRRLLLSMYRQRARTFCDIERLGPFLFGAPAPFDDKQVQKHLEREGGWDRLAAARGALAAIPTFTAERVGEALAALVTETDGIGRFAQPIRIALTGDGVSPEIQQTLAFLGREVSLARIDALLASRTSADQRRDSNA